MIRPPAMRFKTVLSVLSRISPFRNLILKTGCIAGFLLISVIPLSADSQQQKPDISLTDSEISWIKQKHLVRVRVGNWPPFLFDEGEFKGISVDYVKKIFSLHSIDYQFISAKDIPWKTALRNIENHEIIDLLPTAKITEERKQLMIFTDEYLFLPWVIFSRNDSPFLSGIEDLHGKTVCVPDGYVMHDLLKKKYPKINLKLVSGGNSVPRCLEILASGKVDAYVGNLAVGTYVIQNKGYTNLKVAAPTPFGTHNNAMAIRSDWPELASIINKALRGFSPEEHAEIRNKWLSVRYEYGIRPLDVLRWILGVSGVSLFILIIILFWNRRLNKEIKRRRILEEVLQESENRHRSLSDAAFEGIIITKQGRLIEVNDSMAKMIGYNTDELVGRDIMQFIPQELRDGVKNKISTGYELQYESACLRKDGSIFPVEIQSKTYLYQGEEVRVTAIRDITQKKQTEEEIKNLRGIIPICASCKKIRDDKGYWSQVEAYIEEHSEAQFSHGLCIDCADEIYGKQEWYKKGKKSGKYK